MSASSILEATRAAAKAALGAALTPRINAAGLVAAIDSAVDTVITGTEQALTNGVVAADTTLIAGKPPAPSATIDATNAANITSGVFDISRLPPGIIGVGDFPGLVYGDFLTSSAADRIAIGTLNGNILGQRLRDAASTGYKRPTLDGKTILVNNQNSGRPALYVSGTAASNTFIRCEGTQFILAGTDRTNMPGLAGFEALYGPAGFEGAFTVDCMYPQTANGFISKVIGDTRFVFTADEYFPWTDFDKAVVYDPILQGFTGRLCYSINGQTPGTLVQKASGADQITGYDYIIDMSSPVTVLAGIKPVVGMELVLVQSNNNFLVTGSDAEKIVLPEGMRVFGTPNGVYYGQNTSIDSDFHAEARTILSQVQGRGMVRRRMFGGGGYLFTPGLLLSNIGGTVIGTEDDALDVAAFSPNIASVAGGTVQIATPDNRVPKTGAIVSFMGANGVSLGYATVASNTIVGSNTNLTFKGAIPAGVDSTCRIVNTSTSRGAVIKSNTRLQCVGSCALRTSQQRVKIQDGVILGPSIGPALQVSGGGGSESAVYDTFEAGVLHIESGCSGLGFERTAAVVCRPLNVSNSDVAAAGAIESFRIDSLLVKGKCNGPVLAVAGAKFVHVRNISAEGLNQNPTGFGQTLGSSISLINVTKARIDEYTEYDKQGYQATISCGNVGTLELGEKVDMALPTSGFGTLNAWGRWRDFAPVVTPQGGSLGGPVSSANGFRYKINRNKTGMFAGRLDFPANMGTASGLLVVTLPFTTGIKTWGEVLVGDEQHLAGGITLAVGANASTATLYKAGSAGDMTPFSSASLFLASPEFELA